MDCDQTPLTCQLEELTRAVQEPSSLELWAVWISAFAAVGTVTVAIFNGWLLWRQHVLARRMYEDKIRAKRGEIAHVLRNIAGGILSARAAGLQWEWMEHTDEFDRLTELSEAMGDRNLKLPTQDAMRIAENDPLRKESTADFMKAHDKIAKLLDDWVEDPAAYDLAKKARSEGAKSQ